MILLKDAYRWVYCSVECGKQDEYNDEGLRYVDEEVGWVDEDEEYR